MNRYSYQARDSGGQPTSGIIEARDQSQAAKLLRERGLLIISLSPYKEKSLSKIFTVFQHVGLADLASFTRQLSTMMTAGLPLTDALSLLANQASAGLKAPISDIVKSVEGGASLASALKKHSNIFSKVYIALIQAGESAGVLEEILSRLAETLEKQRQFRSKVKGALIYPVIIVIAMVIVAFIMMIFVIPRLTEFYQEFGADLPFITKILIGASNLAVRFWWLAILTIGSLIYFFYLWKKTAIGRRSWDEFMLKVPILGNLMKGVTSTEFTRTLSLLVGAGIPIVSAMEITANALNNEVYRSAIIKASKQVEKGFPIAASISEFEIFPPILSQMMTVGEESGKLDEVLSKLSKYFESEAEEMVKGLTSAIEPIIMILLGVGVGFMVFAVIIPIYKLTSQF